MRSLIKGIIAEGRVRPGSIFWTPESRAKVYIDQRVAEPIGKPIPPAEVGIGVPQGEKKSVSPASPTGPSTASAASSEPGLITSSSLSPAAQASPESKPRAPRKRKAPDKT